MSDNDFPALHIRPREGWVNDPNGPFFWEGRYHVFYQCNPEAAVHGNIHWGHASSDDLVSWRDEGIALRPRPGMCDCHGCWSGCVVNDAGVPTALYTAASDDTGVGVVALARSGGDLVDWRVEPRPAAAPPEGAELLGFRDPFVFAFDGARFGIVGAGIVGGGQPQVLLYECGDLNQWNYLGPLLTVDDPVAAVEAPCDIWECPQLFELDGQWVLLLSRWTGNVLGPVTYLTGTLERRGGGLVFVAALGGAVDHGADFYAPAVLVQQGRVLLWGWSWEGAGQSHKRAWAGALTFPRQLCLGPAGQLVCTPAPELDALRGPASETAGLGTAFEVTVCAASEVTVELTCPTGWLRVRRNGRELRLTTAHRTVAVPDAAARLRILVDGSLVEVFAEDGPCFTERVYPGPTGRWSLQVSDPRAKVVVYPLAVPAKDPDA